MYNEDTVITILLVMLSIPAVIIFVDYVRHWNEEHVYSAWVKLTGNPKKLTYEEWLTLPKNIKEKLK